MKKKIIVLLGSTKSSSINQKIVDYFTQNTEAFFEIEIYPIHTLPYFNPDLESDFLPQSVVDFLHKIESADGVFICTPEYVFSIPGILKNALEWLVSTIVFNEKPTAIVTAASSGEAAHAYIQLIIRTIGGIFNEKTAVLIALPKSKISQTGEITEPKTAALLQGLIQNFKESIA